MTLYSLPVARCTSARPLREPPGTSSTPHVPDTVSQPSESVVRSGRSSGPAARAKRLGVDAPTPRNTVAATTSRLDNLIMRLLRRSRRPLVHVDERDRIDAAGVCLGQFYAGLKLS